MFLETKVVNHAVNRYESPKIISINVNEIQRIKKIAESQKTRKQKHPEQKPPVTPVTGEIDFYF